LIAIQEPPDFRPVSRSTPLRTSWRTRLIGATDHPKRVADALESGAIGYMLLDTPPGDIATTLRRVVKES